MKKLLFFVLLCVSMPLFADNAQIQSLIEQEKYKEAYELAIKDENQIGDVTFDYLLGVAALESGNPHEAVFAFERILMKAPRDVQGRLQLGRAFLATGQIDAAKAQFEVVLNSEADKVTKQNAQLYLDSMAKKNRRINRSNGRVTAQMSVGYSSNINSAPSSADIGPFLANPDIPEAEKADIGAPTQDGYANLMAEGGYLKRFNKTFAMDTFAQANYRKNFQSLSYDYLTLRGAERFLLRFGDFVLSFPLETEAIFLAFEPSAITALAGVHLAYEITPMHLLAFRPEFRFLYNFLHPERGALGVYLPIDWQMTVYPAQLVTLVRPYLHLAYPLSRAGAFAVKGYYGGLLTVYWQYLQPHSFMLQFKGEQSNYLAEHALFKIARSDINFETSLLYNWQVLRWMSVFASYSFLANLSNIDLFDHMRHQAEIGIAFQY